MGVTGEVLYPDGSLTIREVGFRDGLQMVSSAPTTEEKIAWMRAEYAAGIRHFEVGSYVPASTMPQFADVDHMVGAAKALGAYASTLVLNKKGALRALDGGSDEIMFVISASEAHNLANANRTREATKGEIIDMIDLIRGSVSRPVISVAIAMSYGCSISGKESVTIDDVAELAVAFAAAGADVLNIADTVGYAGPPEVSRLLKHIRSAVWTTPIGAHFHDTRGLGIANAAAAIDAGVSFLDASLGGLGGCPFAPAASGNVVTEDIVFLAQQMGYSSNISVPGLVEARHLLETFMPSERFYGQLVRAGLPKRASA